MVFQLLVGLLITISPVFELRVGLPIVLDYAIKNDLSISLLFVVTILVNILIIFPLFLFLDHIHLKLKNLPVYNSFVKKHGRKKRLQAEKLAKSFHSWGFFALAFFVAIPFPGSGAWSGTIIAWALGLRRLESILAISAGITVSGLLVFLAYFSIIAI